MDNYMLEKSMRENEINIESVINGFFDLSYQKIINKEIDKFYEVFNSHYKQAYYNSDCVYFFGIIGNNNPEGLEGMLKLTNFTLNSLNGDWVILFNSPVFISTIELAGFFNKSNDVTSDAIRLISDSGQHKIVSSNPKSIQPDPNIKPDVTFSVYDVVWGFVLPNKMDFNKVNLITLDDLFKNAGFMQDLMKHRESLLEMAKKYNSSILKGFDYINSALHNKMTEYSSVEERINIILAERERVDKSLSDSKVIYKRVNDEVELITKRFEANKADLDATEIKTIDAKSNLDAIVDKVKKNTSTLDSLQEELITANMRLTELSNIIRRNQKEIDSNSLDMKGFSRASRMHLWVCYIFLAALLSTLTNIFYQIYGSAISFTKLIDNSLAKMSTLDILLSRLPLVTATTLVIGTLSTLLFFLVKHIVNLNDDKMNMLKASILAEQITYSLGFDEQRTPDELVELRRNTKVELLIKIFDRKILSAGVDENKQIDLISKVLDVVKK